MSFLSLFENLLVKVHIVENNVSTLICNDYLFAHLCNHSRNNFFMVEASRENGLAFGGNQNQIVVIRHYENMFLLYVLKYCTFFRNINVGQKRHEFFLFICPQFHNSDESSITKTEQMSVCDNNLWKRLLVSYCVNVWGLFPVADIQNVKIVGLRTVQSFLIWGQN